MRRYVDLHMREPAEGGALEKMIGFASELGYRSVAVAAERVDTHKLKPMGEGLNVDLASRVDLIPRSDRELTAWLCQVRRGYEVVAVECHSKTVARQAAKDHRVDVLNFSNNLAVRTRVWFDREEAGLASDGGLG